MAINPKLGYSDATEALIQRMCRNVEREDFELDKPKAEELLMKTYDLFGLDRPSKVVWFDDLNDGYYKPAGSAWSAWSAGLARSARSAGLAGRTALDYDFGYFVIVYEYCQNPDADRLPNEHDQAYLEYSELLMQAKEAGAGYRVEHEDTLYIVPTPIVRIDSQNRFHSDTEPAIRWKNGSEHYLLCGVKFEKDLWQTITGGSLTAKDIAEIQDVDQRKIAMTYLSGDDFITGMKAELVHEGKPVFYEHTANRRIVKHRDGVERGTGHLVVNRLYRIPAGEIYDDEKYFLYYKNPSTGEMHHSFVTNFVKKVGRDADKCMAAKHGTTTRQFMAGGGA